MADIEEEELVFKGPAPEDIDLSDETQDFRFLAQLTLELLLPCKSTFC